MTDTLTTTREMLTDLRAKLAIQQTRLEAELATTGMDHSWIVTTGHDLPVDFMIDPEGRLQGLRIGLTHTVRRLPMRMAQRCAKLVRDGTGAAGKAVRIDHALAADIDRTRELIAVLEEHLNDKV